MFRLYARRSAGSWHLGDRDDGVPPSGTPGLTYDEFFLPHGLLTAGQMFALMAQRHMIEYGSTPEQLGSIAVACRDRAQANPAAQMHGRLLTMDDYLSARMICSPSGCTTTAWRPTGPPQSS
jgi:acetyl-CoA acetyltransferase